MFLITLDLSAIKALGEDLPANVERAMREAGADLAAAAHGHVLEQVQAKLHSSRQKYVDALSFRQINQDAWMIELGPEAFFIEEGLPAGHEMIDDLLKPGRKNGKQPQTAKDGSKFKVIPFEHNKGPASQTPMQKSLTDMVKSELKARKIPYGKLERGPDGKPKVGLLHSLDIKSPLSKSGIPLLQGVRIYQAPVKDKQGLASVKRAVMTFRTVSSKHKGSGKWVHPGLEPRLFMDEAYKWALDHWSNKILPDLVAKVAGT